MSLEKYVQKRDFNKTPEPQEGKIQPKGELRFVVQRHQASKLHYDFRLEMEGVLKSWAMPKGPSMNPVDKRLAVMVEDHPFAYRNFEGQIPEGSYGAGIVRIWDEGTYHAEQTQNRQESEQLLLEALEKGSLTFVLHGNKLKGAFSLVRMKRGDGDDNWLLIKQKDEEAITDTYNSEDYVEGNQKDKPIPATKTKKKSTSKPSVGKKDNTQTGPAQILDLTESNQKLKPRAVVTSKAKHNHANESSNGSDADVNVEIEGHTIKLTNLNKIYWPEEGYTKGELIHYYRQVAKWMLPYLKERPQSLHRHPNGIKDAGFYQRDIKNQLPEWIETLEIYAESTRRNLAHILCQNEATLVYMNNLGCIEIHPWNARVQSLETPDYLAIDLDPGENTYDEVVEVALVVKKVMDHAGVTCFCKTSGATGMHIFAPLGKQFSFEQAEAFARRVAEIVHAQLPELTSLERSPKERRKQVYVDYLQNNKGQSLAAVYSVRPKPGATVSTPLHWHEVKKGLHPSAFTIQTVPERLNQIGDIFGGVLGAGVNLEAGLEKLITYK